MRDDVIGIKHTPITASVRHYLIIFVLHVLGDEYEDVASRVAQKQTDDTWYLLKKVWRQADVPLPFGSYPFKGLFELLKCVPHEHLLSVFLEDPEYALLRVATWFNAIDAKRTNDMINVLFRRGGKVYRIDPCRADEATLFQTFMSSIQRAITDTHAGITWHMSSWNGTLPFHIKNHFTGITAHAHGDLTQPPLHTVEHRPCSTQQYVSDLHDPDFVHRITDKCCADQKLEEPVCEHLADGLVLKEYQIQALRWAWASEHRGGKSLFEAATLRVDVENVDILSRNTIYTPPSRHIYFTPGAGGFRQKREISDSDLKAVGGKDKSKIICLPTGAGKTVIMLMIARMSNPAFRYSIIVVPNSLLDQCVSQAREKFKWGGDTGYSLTIQTETVARADEKDDGGNMSVCIVSRTVFQSKYNVKKRLDGVRVLFDEAREPGVRNTLRMVPHAYAVTATPHTSGINIDRTALGTCNPLLNKLLCGRLFMPRVEMREHIVVEQVIYPMSAEERMVHDHMFQQCNFRDHMTDTDNAVQLYNGLLRCSTGGIIGRDIIEGVAQGARSDESRDLERPSEQSLAASDEACLICLNSPYVEPVQTSCRHVMCKRCLASWMSRSSICPACRQPITSIYNPPSFPDVDSLASPASSSSSGKRARRELTQGEFCNALSARLLGNMPPEEGDDRWLHMRGHTECVRHHLEHWWAEAQHDDRRLVIYVAHHSTVIMLWHSMERVGTLPHARWAGFGTIGNQRHGEASEVINRFRHGDGRVLVVHHRHNSGYDIGAEDLWMLTPTGNRAVMQQAMGRACRLGQRNEVTRVKVFMAEKSLAHFVWRRGKFANAAPSKSSLNAYAAWLDFQNPETPFGRGMVEIQRRAIPVCLDDIHFAQGKFLLHKGIIEIHYDFMSARGCDSCSLRYVQGDETFWTKLAKAVAK